MLVSTYDRFVQDSDQSVGQSHRERLDIATYGLAAEIGSVVAAVKKRLLGEGGSEVPNVANDEILEELGDVVWYCFSLARLSNPGKSVNIFAHDVSNLRREIGAGDERADRIGRVLDPDKRQEFMRASESFPKKTREMTFDDYQSIAFLTARTEDQTLAEVCLAVLWQLSAELFRLKLPDIELELNKSLADRPVNDVLGEIAWHVAALASVYNVSLSRVAELNMAKVSFRLDRGHPTPLHDDAYPPSEQLPRHFEVAFVTVAKGRSRMYLDGRRLGDDLTDNSYAEDGYRFHDIMHLANAAKLGWSPVLRALIGRKRKSNPAVDMVEDGARARIVEEAVIKAIHSEGRRVATLRGPAPPGAPARLFLNSSEITFRFLKFIRNFVADLEVENNRYWEWEGAILDGHDIFYRLHCEGQGTVVVDLDQRSISFRPEVCFQLGGKLAGLGSARLDRSTLNRHLLNAPAEPGGECIEGGDAARLVVQKLAILDSLRIQGRECDLGELQVKEVERGISVKASGLIQKAMWDRGVVGFQTTMTQSSSGELNCTAIALADD